MDFGGQRSKVKVTMDVYGNKLVNTIETKPLCIFYLFQLPDIVDFDLGILFVMDNDSYFMTYSVFSERTCFSRGGILSTLVQKGAVPPMVISNDHR